jgi:ankyrin repeat protein
MAAGSTPRVVLALVATGADVNAKDADGVTALMYAASLESAPLLVPALLKKGANAKVADKSGKKAVDYARQNAKLNGSPALQQLIDAS